MKHFILNEAYRTRIFHSFHLHNLQFTFSFHFPHSPSGRFLASQTPPKQGRNHPHFHPSLRIPMFHLLSLPSPLLSPIPRNSLLDTTHQSLSLSSHNDNYRQLYSLQEISLKEEEYRSAHSGVSFQYQNSTCIQH